MDERRMKGLMGLCVRAGQAVFGEEACRKSITGGQCGILLLDSGISETFLVKLGLEYKYLTWYVTGKMEYEEMKQELGLAIKRFAPGMIIIAPWREWNIKSRD